MTPRRQRHTVAPALPRCCSPEGIGGARLTCDRNPDQTKVPLLDPLSVSQILNRKQDHPATAVPADGAL
jgi:hypothetical protein